MLENVRLAYNHKNDIWYTLDFRLAKKAPKIHEIIYQNDDIGIIITYVKKLTISKTQPNNDYHNYNYYEYHARFYDKTAKYTENIISRCCVKK